MALIKTSRFAHAAAVAEPGAGAARSTAGADAQKRQARNVARQQKAAERIAAATSQLAAGIAEGSAASEELKRAMDQIAAGAEESSTAAQESMQSVGAIAAQIARAKDGAETSVAKTAALQTLVAGISSQISESSRNSKSKPQRSAKSSKPSRASPTRRICSRSMPQSKRLAPDSTAKVSRLSRTRSGRWPKHPKRARAIFKR